MYARNSGLGSMNVILIPPATSRYSRCIYSKDLSIRQLPEQRGRHQFQAAVQVADPGVEQRVRGEGVHPVADVVPVPANDQPWVVDG